ncbi:MAG: DUF3667 domain-containing protein [Bacteroidota bacterium]
MPSSQCLNCAVPLHGKFCANCGQRSSTQRFTFRRIFSAEFLSETFNLNQGLLRTCRGLVLRPGHLIRDYLRGQRKSYFNFFGLLLILLALEALLWSFAYNSPASVLLESMEGTLAEGLRMEDIQKMLNSQKIIFPIIVPIMALAPFLLLRRLGFNYAECCIVVIFLLSMNTLLGTILGVIGLFPLSLPVYKALYGGLSVIVLGFGLLLFWQLSRPAEYSLLGRLWRVLVTWLFTMFILSLALQFSIGIFTGYRKAAERATQTEKVIAPTDSLLVIPGN